MKKIEEKSTRVKRNLGRKIMKTNKVGRILKTKLNLETNSSNHTKY